ncbi:MAG: SpoIID/LytB domain-containing protein [Ilumatobacteraceae bacterium]
MLVSLLLAGVSQVMLAVPAAAVPAAALPAVAIPGVAAAAAVPVASVDLVGHGYGHGVGLSQWGAYGYAVDFDWTAGQIIDHYYGGTVDGTSDVDAVVSVRLQGLDNLQTAVVSNDKSLTINGTPVAARSAVARETPPGAGTYTVWIRPDDAVCPTADALDGGWTVFVAGVPKATFGTTNPVDTTDRSVLLGACQDGGSVRSYRGSIVAVRGSVGELRTVNYVPVEQYLRAVVAKEMSPSWALAGNGRGLQALEAQVIAGRSYALAEHRYTYAMTCDTLCQTYQGAGAEHPWSDPAVSLTAGQVRRDADGKFVVAMYSASSGGYTTPTSLGFTPVPDDGDATAANPNHNWSVTLSASAIQTAYRTIGSFTGLTITQRNGLGDFGGRVLAMVVSGSTGSVTVTGDQFRIALGLKSNWFTLAGPPPAPVQQIDITAVAYRPAVRVSR